MNAIQELIIEIRALITELRASREQAGGSERVYPPLNQQALGQAGWDQRQGSTQAYRQQGLSLCHCCSPNNQLQCHCSCHSQQ